MKTEKTGTRRPHGWRHIQIQAAKGQLRVSPRPSRLAEGVSVPSWLHPESRTGVWRGKPGCEGGDRQWWLSHLVKLSSRSISIRKGGPLCLGLSPCRDRVHKCGLASGTVCWQCWVPQLPLCRGWPAPYPRSLSHHSYFHTMCQLSLGRSLLRDMGGAHLLAGAEEAVVASHLLSTPEMGAPLPAPPGGPARCAVGLRPMWGGSALTLPLPPWFSCWD